MDWPAALAGDVLYILQSALAAPGAPHDQRRMQLHALPGCLLLNKSGGCGMASVYLRTPHADDRGSDEEIETIICRNIRRTTHEFCRKVPSIVPKVRCVIRPDQPLRPTFGAI